MELGSLYEFESWSKIEAFVLLWNLQQDPKKLVKLEVFPELIYYLAPAKNSREDVNKVPFTAPKVEQATKMGMIHAIEPKKFVKLQHELKFHEIFKCTIP